ncbi:MAG: tRNA (adenosine(37)-N6)-threonylcarbamoyltransferase complex transferase subunit TsaD [Pseudomonadota bacterium]
MDHNFTILGIETSCDETALAIISGNLNKKPVILSELLFSQIEEHSPFGGVVPEIAARAHAERMPLMLQDIMQHAKMSFKDFDAIAVTSEPGLIGGVIVGLMTAKGIAVAAQKPFIGVNHLEGHALSPMLTEDISFPYLLLLVSGGHCQIIIVYDYGSYEEIGTTIDDAAGEAFDKVAKMLNLGFPGGPKVEQAAQKGDPLRFQLPRPLCQTSDPNFSFSGLKTAVMRIIEKDLIKTQQDIYDLCASFQYAVSDTIENRMDIAIDIFKQRTSLSSAPCVVAGGVAANMALRHMLENLSARHNMDFFAPPLKYCTDNAVMIAYAGLVKFARKNVSSLSLKPMARAPLGRHIS